VILRLSNRGTDERLAVTTDNNAVPPLVSETVALMKWMQRMFRLAPELAGT
jgi:hypothetical protein